MKYDQQILINCFAIDSVQFRKKRGKVLITRKENGLAENDISRINEFTNNEKKIIFKYNKQSNNFKWFYELLNKLFINKKNYNFI